MKLFKKRVVGDIDSIFSARAVDKWNELDEKSKKTVVAISVNAVKINSSSIGY